MLWYKNYGRLDITRRDTMRRELNACTYLNSFAFFLSLELILWGELQLANGIFFGHFSAFVFLRTRIHAPHHNYNIYSYNSFMVLPISLSTYIFLQCVSSSSYRLVRLLAVRMNGMTARLRVMLIWLCVSVCVYIKIPICISIRGIIAIFTSWNVHVYAKDGRSI